MDKKSPIILTTDEQKKLLSQFNLRYISPHRNRTMIQLFLCTGLRLSEITNLKWKHIKFVLCKLYISPKKGKKGRTLYIDISMVNELKLWRKRQLEVWGETEYVFTTRNLVCLDGKAIRKMLKIYTKKANIDKNVTPQSLRDTFQHDLYEESKDIQVVKKALGCSKIVLNQKYNYIIEDKLQTSMKNLRNKK